MSVSPPLAQPLARLACRNFRAELTVGDKDSLLSETSLFGSNCDIEVRRRDFRFTPNCGRIAVSWRTYSAIMAPTGKRLFA
jgi:hypothetical protein